MAQNITLLGASYSDVPAVELPKTGGGTASFVDISDTTATASDVASGKDFYLADGTKTTGTASGGSIPTYIQITNLTISGGNSEQTDLTINVKKFGTLNINALSTSSTWYLKTIDINPLDGEAITFQNPSSSSSRVRVETFNVHGAKIKLSGNYNFRYMDRLVTINGVVDSVLNSTVNNQFYTCNALETVYFTENLQTNNVKLQQSPLNEASIISVANSLNESVTGKTLTLKSDRKTMCDSIMGIVSTVTENNVTYRKFTKDASGSTSLSSFITNTKGWSLA